MNPVIRLGISNTETPPYRTFARRNCSRRSGRVKVVLPVDRASPYVPRAASPLPLDERVDIHRCELHSHAILTGDEQCGAT